MPGCRRDTHSPHFGGLNPIIFGGLNLHNTGCPIREPFRPVLQVRWELRSPGLSSLMISADCRVSQQAGRWPYSWLGAKSYRSSYVFVIHIHFHLPPSTLHSFVVSLSFVFASLPLTSTLYTLHSTPLTSNQSQLPNIFHLYPPLLF